MQARSHDDPLGLWTDIIPVRRSVSASTRSGRIGLDPVTLVTRWLVPFADETTDHGGGRQVGRADLREGVDDAHRWAPNATAGTGKPTPSPAASTTGPPRVVALGLGGEDAAPAGPGGERATDGARAV